MLPDYRLTDFFFVPKSSNAVTMASQRHQGILLSPKSTHQICTMSKELPQQPSAMTGGVPFQYTNASFTNS